MLKPLREKVQKLEARIEALEAQKKEVTDRLGDASVYADAKKRNELLKKFEETKDELELLTSQWEAASVELEQRESELEGS